MSGKRERERERERRERERERGGGREKSRGGFMDLIKFIFCSNMN